MQKQKDYWDISKKNFRALGILMILYVVIFGMDFFNDSSAVDKFPIFLIISGSLAILFFIIAALFKRRSPYAITAGYIYTGMVFVYVIIKGFIMNSPLDGIVGKVLGMLVLFYLFYNVRKAAQQKIGLV